MEEIFLAIGTLLLISAFSILMYLGAKRSVWSKYRTKSVTDELDKSDIKLVKLFVSLALLGILCYLIQFLFIIDPVIKH